MAPKSLQNELSHPCAHPDCCSQNAAEGKAASGSQGEPLAPVPENQAGSLTGSLKHWLLGFLAFFGIYASSSVCPFCGTPGCPVGPGGAALVGGVFAWLWQYGRKWGEGLVRLLRKPFAKS